MPNFQNKPSSNVYFENLVDKLRVLTICDHSIQNLKQCLFFNKSFIFLKPPPLCSFCDLYNKLPIQIFHECGRVKFS